MFSIVVIFLKVRQFIFFLVDLRLLLILKSRHKVASCRKGDIFSHMRYQYKRELLTQDEANRLANACQTHEEKLIIWTLLDTGLRVAELANLTRDNLGCHSKCCV